MTPETNLHTPKETSAQLDVEVTTLAKWRSRGCGPSYAKIGGKVRYPAAAISEFIASRTIVPGAPPKRARKRRAA